MPEPVAGSPPASASAWSIVSSASLNDPAIQLA
jgi:hypothetical protein